MRSKTLRPHRIDPRRMAQLPKAVEGWRTFQCVRKEGRQDFEVVNQGSGARFRSILPEPAAETGNSIGKINISPLCEIGGRDFGHAVVAAKARQAAQRLDYLPRVITGQRCDRVRRRSWARKAPSEPAWSKTSSNAASAASSSMTSAPGSMSGLNRRIAGSVLAKTVDC